MWINLEIQTMRMVYANTTHYVPLLDIYFLINSGIVLEIPFIENNREAFKWIKQKYKTNNENNVPGNWKHRE